MVMRLRLDVLRRIVWWFNRVRMWILRSLILVHVARNADFRVRLSSIGGVSGGRAERGWTDGDRGARGR